MPTTISSLSNGQGLPFATINVISTTGFLSSGKLNVVTSAGIQIVAYTGLNPTQFTGCSGGTGTMFTGNDVSARYLGLALIPSYGTGILNYFPACPQPLIYTPSGDAVVQSLTFTTNGSNQTFSGVVAGSPGNPNATAVLVNGLANGVTYNTTTGIWTYSTTLNEGQNVYNVTALCTDAVVSLPAVITVTLVSRFSLSFIVQAPTGLVMKQFINQVQIVNAQNPEPQVIGYNYFCSTEAGGGLTGYTQINPALVTTATYTQQNTIGTNTITSVVTTPSPALVNGTGGPPYNLTDTFLIVTIDGGTPQSIPLFGGSVSIANAVAQINSIANGFFAEYSTPTGNVLAFSSLVTGATLNSITTLVDLPTGVNFTGYTLEIVTGSGAGQVVNIIGLSTTMPNTFLTSPAFSVVPNTTSEISIAPSNAVTISLATVSTGLDATILINSGSANTALGFTLDTYRQGSLVNTQTDTTTTTYQNVDYFSFIHNRNNNVTSSPNPTLAASTFSGIPTSTPLYYVIQAVAYDNTQNQEYVSIFSAELVGQPVTITTNIQDLTPRQLRDIQTDAITLVNTADSNVTLAPGSDTRDIFIDPAGQEEQNLWLFLDFSHRAQSFLTLIQLDSPGGTGVSSDPSTDPYKLALGQALNLTPAQIEQLIDDAFTKLAGNFDVQRLPAANATGQITFFTLTTPVANITIPAGTTVSTVADPSNNVAAITFITTATVVMIAANASSYFNVNTQRYEISDFIRAISPGSAGNVDAETITQLLSNVGAAVGVINPDATLFGSDIESNYDLAQRAMLSFIGFDSGTSGGYLKTSISVPGVFNAEVISAGDPLMFRDYDSVRMKNIGGKVDIWIQGIAEIIVSDVFAFTFTELQNQVFTVVNAPTYTFIINDPVLTTATPLIAIIAPMTDVNSTNPGNIGQIFNLTGLVITGYNTFQLVASSQTFTPIFNDTILGNFRYRNTNAYTFQKQPVTSIVSVVGSLSGTLTSAGFELLQLDDPALTGDSTIATDQLEIIQVNGIPSGARQSVTGESHVLVGRTPVNLNLIGVDPTTITITNLSGSITYQGDNQIPQPVTPDFFVTSPTNPFTQPTTITRNPSGTITDGETVLVSYMAEENFTVTYDINDLLQTTQTKINEMKHITADVIVKQAIDNSVDIDMTVVLTSTNVNQTTVDIAIRTNLTNVVNTLKTSASLGQSAIITQAEIVSGVGYVVTPLNTFIKANGSFILRESVVSEFILVAQSSTAIVYLLTEQLSFSVYPFGAPSNIFSGVFQNEIALNLVDNLVGLETGAGNAIIVGYQGLAIGSFTATQTANKILVSVAPTDSPANHSYAVTYTTAGATGASSLITTAEAEYLSLGSVTITYTVA